MYATKRPTIAILVALVLAMAAGPLLGGDWTRFRGPNGSGVCTDSEALPVTFDETENMAWKTQLPGPGSSSPILVGDRLFVTCWTGYGTDPEEPGDPENLRRHLVCLDRHSGELLWSRSVAAALPEDPYGGMFAQNGYASHTPVSDGKHVFAYFGKSGAVAFDLDGKILWQTRVGDELDPQKWGSASSPILYDDLVIVTATAECEGLVALDKKTGKERWRQEAAGFNGTWGTPVLVEVDDSRTDLVIAVAGEMWGFDPKTGAMRWLAKSVKTNNFCSSVVTSNGIVYAMESGPSGGGGIAVRAGGDGDVTDSHVEWVGRQSNSIASPVLHKGRIYSVSGGILACFDAGSGNEIFKMRLENPGEDEASMDRRARFMSMNYASPIVADDKIYFVSRKGHLHVLKPGTGKDCETLAINSLGDGTEDFSATPAADDGQLFVRSDKYLYCFADEPEAAVAAADEASSEAEYRPQGGGNRGGGGGNPQERDRRAGRPDRPQRPGMGGEGDDGGDL